MAWNIGREFAINTLNIILFISSLRFLGKPFWDEGTTGLGSQRDRVSDLGRRLDLK